MSMANIFFYLRHRRSSERECIHISAHCPMFGSMLRTNTISFSHQALDLIGFICIQMSAFSYHSRGGFFSYVAMQGFWFTGIMFGLYVFQVVYKYNRVPWMRIEMWVCAVSAALYLLASCLAASFGTEAFIAAAVSQ